MSTKQVSVRLAVIGGEKVRTALEGVGEAGKRGLGRLSQEMEAANRRLAGFARRVKVASAAAVAATMAAQAQKHVTHNEALRLLDGLVHLSVLDRDLTAPRPTPAKATAISSLQVRQATGRAGI